MVHVTVPSVDRVLMMMNSGYRSLIVMLIFSIFLSVLMMIMRVVVSMFMLDVRTILRLGLILFSGAGIRNPEILLVCL